ncbi:MAG: hypothetical protein JJE52_05760 [Acidimicrobiia bacterium]|nr:hypothetical protein [Acidimicrobiia bacterium]
MNAAPLSDALAELEERWRLHAASTKAGLAPGSDSAAIAAPLEAVGFVPSDELEVWFAWQAGQAVPGTTVGPALIPLSVDQAVDARAQSLELAESFKVDLDPGLEPPDLWDPSWLPLTQFAHGGYFAAECRPVREQTSAVWRYETSHMPGRRIAGSIAELVATWIRLIDDGYWRWDAERGMWRLSGGLPPADLQPFQV